MHGEMNGFFILFRSVTYGAVLHRLVAESAVYADLPGLVAFHAAAHGNVALLEKLVALGDFAVAVLAGGGCFQVSAVTEIDVRGNLVYPHPGDFLVLLGGGGQL